MAGSGMFLCAIIARTNVSMFRLPDLLTWLLMRRLADLTAASARPLLCGKWADKSLCCTFQARIKSWVKCDVNSSPPSEESVSGTPLSAKTRHRHAMRPAAPEAGVPHAARVMSSHPDNRSTVTK